MENIAEHQLQPRDESKLTTSSGLLPMSTTQSQMRSDRTVQDVCCPRTPGAMHLPSTERVASACEENKHGTGPERA